MYVANRSQSHSQAISRLIIQNILRMSLQRPIRNYSSLALDAGRTPQRVKLGPYVDNWPVHSVTGE